jgi:hypothetical protein
MTLTERSSASISRGHQDRRARSPVHYQLERSIHLAADAVDRDRAELVSNLLVQLGALRGLLFLREGFPRGGVTVRAGDQRLE